MNMFLEKLTQGDTLTWNGALSNSSSGCSLLDYFAKCGSYRGRELKQVAGDMSSIFGTDSHKAMRIVLYNRMVTRKPHGYSEVARGQGQKDEFIKSLAWLEVNRPDVLKQNLWLVPVVGCWKDLWYDSQATKYYHYVDTDLVYPLVAEAIQDASQRQLVAKYLPKIRSSSNVKSDRHRRLNAWAKGLCEYLGWSERDYRKFKSAPENTAHNFQRVICSGRWEQLDFAKVPGRALFNLVNGKTLANHNLSDRYLKWIEKQPVAKFTGYPYELYLAATEGKLDNLKRHTYNAQFEQLIKVGRDSISDEVLSKGVLCALDTSGSMGATIGNGKVKAIDVCVGLGIYFSKFLKGFFADTVVMFDSTSRIKKLSGSFCDRVQQVPRDSMGSTNFQSVIDEIVRVRKQNPNVPISDFPEVLLVVSDMQFNPTNSGSYWGSNAKFSAKDTKTNYQEAMSKLKAVGLPPMSIIWWQVNGVNTNDVPSTMFDPGTTLVSGFDGSIVTAILGGQQEVVDEKTGEKRKLTPVEQMNKALDQEVLNLVKV